MVESEIQALQQEIQSAFGNRPYPGDDKIVRMPRDSEAASTWELFYKKDWREILLVGRDLDLRDDLVYLTTEGFIYYLPAFLILSLDIDNLLGPDEDLVFYLWWYRDEVTPLLTQEERRAVVDLLEFLVREYRRRCYVGDNPQLTLDHYRAAFAE